MNCRVKKTIERQMRNTGRRVWVKDGRTKKQREEGRQNMCGERGDIK